MSTVIFLEDKGLKMAEQSKIIEKYGRIFVVCLPGFVAPVRH